MGWLVDERDELARATRKAVGMLSGVQWLLRFARHDPAEPRFSDEDVANMIELVRGVLGTPAAPDQPATAAGQIAASPSIEGALVAP
ncbi:hypothetical protein [Variovorax sp. KK3]|uniref:hypothetical protein n=1 Tax=Variovorax sp. KK3 TaxID=1855728 RepID=UPI00097BBF1F|nr:hypothetical protein [Variovorax sp. KK3]